MPALALSLALSLTAHCAPTQGEAAPAQAPPAPLAPNAEPGPEPPSRQLSRELCSAARLAGTSGSEVGARIAARHLAAAGFQVELDRREVLLSLPRRLELVLWVEPEHEREPLVRVETFDPSAVPPGDVPRFNAWSASGAANGPVVDVGLGLRANYERLAAAGADVRGCVALARYGGAYRGVKARLAEEHGCAALLLFGDPATEGPGAGEVFPRGPFLPAGDAQRGSISALERAPGDPSTPGWPSPAPGAPGERLSAEALDARLPRIPVLPIGWDEAEAILARVIPSPGPGPGRAEIAVDQPRELRPIVNVIARLPGTGPGVVIAGSHRDAWVRGAQDSGSGVVGLLRAAQLLGERWRAGWRPPCTIAIALFDAEESGLIGSTEWGEANAEWLRERCVAYVNADAAVSGTRFHATGTPGLLGALRRTLERLPDPEAHESARSLWDQWAASAGEAGPALALPGSGSDHAVFLHHLAIPVLDLGFDGNPGGQYHTAFDDFPVMDRFLDPGWVGHEALGELLAALLADLAEAGDSAFDAAEAAAALAQVTRADGLEPGPGGVPWLGEARAERICAALDALSGASSGRAFYGALSTPVGLLGRPWYRLRAWAPGLETGYSAETWPELRANAAEGEAALDAALLELESGTNRPDFNGRTIDYRPPHERSSR